MNMLAIESLIFKTLVVFISACLFLACNQMPEDEPGKGKSGAFQKADSVINRLGNEEVFSIERDIFLKEKNENRNKRNNFLVVKSNGRIINRSLKSTLKTNSQFSINDSIQFSSYKDYLILLQGVNSFYACPTKNDLKAYKLLPLRERFNTKPASIEELLRKSSISNYQDLRHLFQKKYSGRNKFLILDGACMLNIDVENFPITDSTFFFVKFQRLDKKLIINKKLKNNNYKVVLDTDILKVKGEFIPIEQTTGFDFFYREEKNKSSLYIGTFLPLFIESSILKKEIDVFVGNMKNTLTKKAIKTKILTYLVQEYGVPTKNDFDIWLSKHYAI